MEWKIEKYKRVLLVTSGGIGRNIFATAVIRNLKKAYPDIDIFVMCGCPDIFQNNPNVKRVYGFDKSQHLFEDYVFENKESIILDVEPYRHPDYLSGNKHVVECWCELLGIDCDSTKPDLFYVKNELAISQDFMTKFTKPLVLFQHTGGKAPDGITPQHRVSAKDAMYRRGLTDSVIQEITDKLIADGYIVGSIQHPNQFQPKGSELIHFPIRAVIGLIPYAEGIIATDSFLQHAAVAFNKPAVVCWAGTSPEKLGYEIHKNLRRSVCTTPECHRPNSYAFDIQSNGMMWNCPYSEVCCDYTADEIINAYKELKGDRYTEVVKEFEMANKNCKEDKQIDDKHGCQCKSA